MRNQYYLTYDLDEAGLRRLTENELMVQVRLIAHCLDKKLQFPKADGTVYSENDLKRLNDRLKIYEEKFDVTKPDYLWALSVKELYFQAIQEQREFRYPWEKKSRIHVDKEEFEKLVLGRRSIRNFTAGEIPDEIVRYGSWAPCTCNMQALRYIVVKSREVKDKIAAGGFYGRNVSCIVAVVANREFYDDWDVDGPIHDSAASMENMLLACRYLDVGACYVSDQGVNQEKYRTLLKIGEPEKITAFLWLGRYEQEPRAPKRRKPDDIIEFV